MKTLLSLKPLIFNPLEIYKYNKVILKYSMCNVYWLEETTLGFYLKKIFKVYNKKYLKSFKYFIQICDNIEFKFYSGYTIINILIFILCNLNHLVYNKNFKQILIYVINKYKSLEIYDCRKHNIVYFLFPGLRKFNKMFFKLYKYILSLNVYYTVYNTYYETPKNLILVNMYINNINKFYLHDNILLHKIQSQQELWRCKRLFILLCIL